MNDPNSNNCILSFCLFITFLTGLTLIGAGCQTTQKIPNRTNLSNPPQQLSHLSLPVTVSFSVLEEKANNVIPQDFDEKVDFEEFGFRASNIAGTRTPFHVKPTANGIAIEARISNGVVDCEFLGNSFTTLVDLVAGVQIDPKLTKDWKLHLNAKPYCTVLKISPGIIPSRCVSMFRGFVARRIIADYLDPQMATWESEIEEMTVIKGEVAKLLTEFRTGVQVNDNPKVWLNVEPVSFHIPKFTTGKSNLICCVGMNAIITTTLDKPMPNDCTKLPPLVDGNGKEQLLINSVLTGSLDKWAETMSPMIDGEEIAVGLGATVQIKKCRFEPRGEQIVVCLTFDTSGGVMNPKGELVLVGKPMFDNRTNEIFLENLDYDLHTRHVFAKCASWLLHDSIRRRITEIARYNFSNDIRALKTSLNDQLQRFEIYDGLILKAKLLGIEVQPIRSQSRILEVPFVLYGKGEIKAEKIELPE